MSVLFSVEQDCYTQTLSNADLLQHARTVTDGLHTVSSDLPKFLTHGLDEPLTCGRKTLSEGANHMVGSNPKHIEWEAYFLTTRPL